MGMKHKPTPGTVVAVLGLLLVCIGVGIRLGGDISAIVAGIALLALGIDDLRSRT